MLGVNSSTRKRGYSSYIAAFVSLVASISASAELALPVKIDIPPYVEPASISFPSRRSLPDLTQILKPLYNDSRSQIQQRAITCA